MGSKSDWETMSHAATTLDELGIPCETRVISAHRTPDILFEYASSAQGRGLEVIIAAAGGQIPSIPKLPNGDYDYKALTEKLMEIKADPANADETKATFNADAQIPYEIVIKTLDAMREDTKGKQLFPDVAFAAGIL